LPKIAKSHFAFLRTLGIKVVVPIPMLYDYT
jgi:hypothetical protein